MDLPGPVMWFLLGRRQDWDNGWHSGDQDADEARSQVDPEPVHSVVDGSSREMPLRRGSLRKGRPGLGWIWLVTLRSVWQQGRVRRVDPSLQVLFDILFLFGNMKQLGDDGICWNMFVGGGGGGGVCVYVSFADDDSVVFECFGGEVYLASHTGYIIPLLATRQWIVGIGKLQL